MMNKKYGILVLSVMLIMALYFCIGQPKLADDGFQYEGFTESLARGILDFKSFYGFMGLSILSVPFFWFTGSHLSVIYVSMLLALASVPLIYFVARDMFNDKKAGILGLIIFLLTPYPYTTLMRGFQEAALLFFILLIIYASIHKKKWTPFVWAFGGIVKPFALTLLPLFSEDLLNNKKIRLFFILGIVVGATYLAVSYYQVGQPVNNAAINSYEGYFDTGNPPPLIGSFTVSINGLLRVGANLLLAYRKIMVSPFLILVGLWVLWKGSQFKYRNAFLIAIILNFLLLGFMTFSFSKYLLPATTLISLAAISFLLKHKVAMLVFLLDSITVFLPIWKFFGQTFWDNFFVYMVPFWLAAVLIVFLIINKKSLTKDNEHIR